MKKFVVKSLVAVLLLVTVAPSAALAWGKRGHEIVAAVAARLLEEKKHDSYLHSHEFDLGYYANVPDIIWKNLGEDTFKIESPQHYIDWTKAFDKAFGSPKDLPVSFDEFKAKLGAEYKYKQGVAPYRIHDLVARCKQIAAKLDRTSQGPLLVCLGELAHYTGDMSMPLHTTDNHDGQFTHQEGIHSYFEDTLVDALDPQLKVNVLDKARGMFDTHVAKKMNSDAAVRWLIGESHDKVETLLNLDHGLDRKNINLAKKKYESLIVLQLAQGAIVTAEVWAEVLEPVKDFDNNKFWFFDGRPEYVMPTGSGAGDAK